MNCVRCDLKSGFAKCQDAPEHWNVEASNRWNQFSLLHTHCFLSLCCSALFSIKSVRALLLWPPFCRYAVFFSPWDIVHTLLSTTLSKVRSYKTITYSCRLQMCVKITDSNLTVSGLEPPNWFLTGWNLKLNQLLQSPYQAILVAYQWQP